MFKKSMKLCLATVIFLFVGCATPYYGYSKSEWEKLSDEEKKTAQAEYDAIIKFKYQQEHEDQFDDRKQQITIRGASAE